MGNEVAVALVRGPWYAVGLAFMAASAFMFCLRKARSGCCIQSDYTSIRARGSFQSNLSVDSTFLSKDTVFNVGYSAWNLDGFLACLEKTRARKLR